MTNELIETSKYSHSEESKYSHGWLDNFGQNNWDYWEVYIKDKNKTIWKATLNIANSSNGEKILYDIYPIEMVEQSVTSDTSSTKEALPPRGSKAYQINSDIGVTASNNRIPQNPLNVKPEKDGTKQYAKVGIDTVRDDVVKSKKKTSTKVKYSPNGLNIKGKEKYALERAIGSNYFSPQKTHEGLQYQSVVGTNTHDLYVYRDFGLGEYQILAKISYQNEAVALDIMRRTDDGKLDTIADVVNRLFESDEVREGGYIIYNTLTGKRRRAISDGSIHQRTSASDAGRTYGSNNTNSGDSGTAESLIKGTDNTVSSFVDSKNKKQFLITDIVGKKDSYGKGVYLDTDIFEGTHPRNWNKVLTS